MKQGTIIRFSDGQIATFVYHGLDGYGLSWGALPSNRWNEPPDILWRDIPEKQRETASFLFTPEPFEGFVRCPDCPTYLQGPPRRGESFEPICVRCNRHVVATNPEEK